MAQRGLRGMKAAVLTDLILLPKGVKKESKRAHNE